MVLSTLAVGPKMECERAKVCNCGKMDQNTRDIGRRIRLTVMADSSTLMATAITEIGLMTRPTVVELTSIWTEPNISAIGKKISSTAME